MKDIDFSNDVWVLTADNTKVGHVTQVNDIITCSFVENQNIFI